jgi:hypothetical protein
MHGAPRALHKRVFALFSIDDLFINSSSARTLLLPFLLDIPKVLEGPAAHADQPRQPDLP